MERNAGQHSLHLTVGKPVGLASEARCLPRRRPGLYEPERLDHRRRRHAHDGEPHQLAVYASDAADELSRRAMAAWPRTSSSRAAKASAPTASPTLKPATRSPTGFSADGYFYNVSDLVNQWWCDGKYTFNAKGSICAVHRAAGRYREQLGAVVYRQGRQPSLRRATRLKYHEKLCLCRRLRSDTLADRFGVPAEERHLQQHELPDLGEVDARILPAAQRAAVLHGEEHAA